MKDCNSTLISELTTKSHFQCCDLFTIVLQNGSVFYIADYDKDIAYNGHTFSHDRFIMKREQTKQSGTPSVDSVNVTIYADKLHTADALNGTHIFKAAHDGVLDDAQLTLYRAFMDDDGVLIDAIELFVGRCDVSSCGGIACKLTVKSEIIGLNTNLPTRIFAAQNTYVTNSNGVVVTSSTDTGTLMIPLKPNQSCLLRF